jgi:hypothetical protein
MRPTGVSVFAPWIDEKCRRREGVRKECRGKRDCRASQVVVGLILVPSKIPRRLKARRAVMRLFHRRNLLPPALAVGMGTEDVFNDDASLWTAIGRANVQFAIDSNCVLLQKDAWRKKTRDVAALHSRWLPCGGRSCLAVRLSNCRCAALFTQSSVALLPWPLRCPTILILGSMFFSVRLGRGFCKRWYRGLRRRVK